MVDFSDSADSSFKCNTCGLKKHLIGYLASIPLKRRLSDRAIAASFSFWNRAGEISLLEISLPATLKYHDSQKTQSQQKELHQK
jgi:hypothetical protein